MDGIPIDPGRIDILEALRVLTSGNIPSFPERIHSSISGVANLGERYRTQRGRVVPQVRRVLSDSMSEFMDRT